MQHFGCPPPRLTRTYSGNPSSVLTASRSMQVPDETAAEVARRERERLRAQTQAKRQQLEKMRAQDMFSGSETEVRQLATRQTPQGCRDLCERCRG